MEDVSGLFWLDQIDHHELLDILTMRYKTCRRVSENDVTFPAAKDYVLKLRLRHGQISKITTGAKLSDRELKDLLKQINDDLRNERIAEYGSDILFASRPVNGGYRFSSIPMQILEAPPEAPRPPKFSAAHPFVLEFPIKACVTPALRTRRFRKNSIEWAWVLNALLQDSISYSSTRHRQLWAINIGAGDMDCFWASESYIVPGHRALIPDLSKLSEQLPIVPAGAYFNDSLNPAGLGVPLDSFYIPDSLDSLINAYIGLDGMQKRRFLRSAATIYMARGLWDHSFSGYFLACIQAIETLFDRPPPQPCPTCGKDTGLGPTKLFKKFVEDHCNPGEVSQKILNELYSVRSALAHGSYLFQLDESPWAFNLAATVSSQKESDLFQSVVTIAKAGLRGWLLNPQKGNASKQNT